MKSGEIREDANGKKTLSFREKKVVNDDGPLGVPVEDWFQIIAFFTVFYSFMAGFFSLLYFWNSVRRIKSVAGSETVPTVTSFCIFTPFV